MKKVLRLTTTALLMLCFSFSLLGCTKNKVTQKNAEWVKMRFEYEIVVMRLNDPDDRIKSVNTYYWFDGAKNISDAQKKLKNGKKIKLIAITFDNDNRATMVQYAELNNQNKAILTQDVVKINLNLTQKNFDRVNSNDSYYDIIDIFGFEDQIEDLGDAKCYRWFSGAQSLEEANQRAKEGETTIYLEILFNNDLRVRYITLTEI